MNSVRKTLLSFGLETTVCREVSSETMSTRASANIWGLRIFEVVNFKVHVMKVVREVLRTEFMSLQNTKMQKHYKDSLSVADMLYSIIPKHLINQTIVNGKRKSRFITA